MQSGTLMPGSQVAGGDDNQCYGLPSYNTWRGKEHPYKPLHVLGRGLLLLCQPQAAELRRAQRENAPESLPLRVRDTRLAGSPAQLFHFTPTPEEQPQPLTNGAFLPRCQ